MQDSQEETSGIQDLHPSPSSDVQFWEGHDRWIIGSTYIQDVEDSEVETLRQNLDAMTTTTTEVISRFALLE